MHELETSVAAAIYARRSVRSYLPRKLDWSTVHALLGAAVQAPTAMHREPWEFVVVQDATQLRRLSDRARVLFADEAHPDLLESGGHSVDIFTRSGFDIFYGAGTLIVIGARSQSTYAVADCWLAAQNLMLAAHARGIASCVIGSALAALNAADAKLELGVPEDFNAIAPIIVGVQAGVPESKTRRDPRVVAWV